MELTAMTTNRNPETHTIRAILLPLVFSIYPLCVLAQQSQYDRSTPPQHAAGVSPLGSYTSADVGTVNLSNGALNLKFPLGSVGGRGFSLPLTLNWSSKIWSGSTDIETDRDGSLKTIAYADFDRLDDYVDFGNRIGPGWTVGDHKWTKYRLLHLHFSQAHDDAAGQR